ncbi:mate-domain-containing protein [Chytriomyces sp. MP71]|nr:mate-domain-containing protein [Chytriomyces sp. MP71]
MLKVSELWTEARQMSPLALPVSIGYLMQMSLGIASVVVLGRVGTTALAAMALSTLFANVTAYSFIVGMAAAIDTLCSQAHGIAALGGGDRRDVGRHLNRTIFLLLVISLPISVLWWFTEPLLLLVGQDEDIAALSGVFTRYLIPSLVPFVISECVKRFLMAQGIMQAQMIVIGIVAPVNALLQYILVISPFKIGEQGIGAPIALTISHTLTALALCCYAIYVEGAEFYAGWEWNHVLDTKKLSCAAKLGFSGVLMTCSEWWAWEIVVLAAGIIGPTSLAAQTIVLNTNMITYTLPLGFSIACTTRIGNSLGASNPCHARVVAWAAVFMGILLALANSSFLLAIRGSLGWLFSDDAHVVALVQEIIPLAALYQTADVLTCIAGGILRGAGRPEIGACLNLVGYYVLGIPIGLVLCFSAGLGLYGMWLGLTVALFVVGVWELYVISRLCWVTEAKNAHARSLCH